MEKAPDAFRTISEVADDLNVPKHVLRFWEGKFTQLRPMKRGGGRRYYRPEDVELLRAIRHLLYSDGYTIRGVQKILRTQGARYLADHWRELLPVASETEDGARGVRAGAREQDDAAETDAVTLHSDDLAALIEELDACRRVLQAAKEGDPAPG